MVRALGAHRQSLTGASFKSVDDLKTHIDADIAAHNETAEPFVWTKSTSAASKVNVSVICDSGY